MYLFIGIETANLVDFSKIKWNYEHSFGENIVILHDTLMLVQYHKNKNSLVYTFNDIDMKE